MMDHVLIDLMDDGQLPIYNFGRTYYYVWQPPGWSIIEGQARRVAQDRPSWELRGYRANGRAILSCELDEPLTLLVDELRGRLESLRMGYLVNPDGTCEIEYRESDKTALEVPGTLVLALRNCSVWDNLDGWLDSDGRGRVQDRHGVVVMGAMGFFPGVEEGHHLRGMDPIYYIEQSCLGFAGKEYDRDCSGVRDAIADKVRARQARQEERLLAERRAVAILLDHLDDEQRAEFGAQRQFHVVGADGYTYLIVDKPMHNVFRVEGGKRTVEYCIITDVPIPNPDQMLTQKLLLEADPALFHEKTNAWAIEEDDEKIRRVFLDPATFEIRQQPV